MFKKISLMVFISTLSLVKAQNISDLLSIPGPIEYDGTEYFLVWSKPMSKTLFRQHYLPRDEQLEDYTQLLDLSFFNKEIDMDLAVRQKVDVIKQREKSDQFAKVNVVESPDGKEFLVDYFISEKPEKGDSFIEYNVYRFKTFENGTYKSFLILSHSKRMYGDLKSAAKSLAKQRDHLITSMIEFKIPDIKVLPQN